MDFDIKTGDDDDRLRKAFRTQVPGLMVRIKDRKEPYQVKDVSAGGFAFLDESRSFKEGAVLEVDLLLKTKLFLGGLKARVMRVLGNGIIGCNLEDLDPRQEARLDKLVLEVQKRLIAQRRLQGDKKE
ncbi:MAG: PilZ domain-containing protein [Desulfovibrionaceae bacterium]